MRSENVSLKIFEDMLACYSATQCTYISATKSIQTSRSLFVSKYDIFFSNFNFDCSTNPIGSDPARLAKFLKCFTWLVFTFV